MNHGANWALIFQHGLFFFFFLKIDPIFMWNNHVQWSSPSDWFIQKLVNTNCFAQFLIISKWWYSYESYFHFLHFEVIYESALWR